MTTSPVRILLIGLGRCGSSAICETLEESSLSHDIGECAETLFGCYHSLKDSLTSLSYTPAIHRPKSELPRRVVNGVFDLILEGRNPRPLVTAKCVGIPSPIHRFIETHGFQAAAQIYVETLIDCFNNAWRFVFLARDPETWIPSAIQRWGMTLEKAWEAIYLYSEIALRMASRAHIVLFEDLRRNPVAVYQDILGPTDCAVEIPALVMRLSERRYAANLNTKNSHISHFPLRSQIDHILEIRRLTYKNYALSGIPYKCFAPFDYCIDSAPDYQQEPIININELKREMAEIWAARLFFEKQSELFGRKVVELQQQNAKMESWIHTLQTRLGKA